MFEYRESPIQQQSTAWSLWHASQPLLIVALFLAAAFGLAYLFVS